MPGLRHTHLQTDTLPSCVYSLPCRGPFLWSLAPGCVSVPRNTEVCMCVGGWGKSPFLLPEYPTFPLSLTIPILGFSASLCNFGSSAWTPGPTRSGQAKRNSLQNLDSQLGHLLRPRAGYCILLKLSVLVCKTGDSIPTSQGCCENERGSAWKGSDRR